MEAEKQSMSKEVMDLKIDLKGLKDIKKTIESEADDRKKKLDSELYHTKSKAMEDRIAANEKITAIEAKKLVMKQQNEILQKKISELEDKCKQLEASKKISGRNVGMFAKSVESNREAETGFGFVTQRGGVKRKLSSETDLQEVVNRVKSNTPAGSSTSRYGPVQIVDPHRMQAKKNI